MTKVRIVPHLDDIKVGESGIHEVIRKWFRYLPELGIELVGKNVDSFDILAVHAGMGSRYPLDANVVSHVHGLYWSADYNALNWEWAANATVIESMLRAKAITVPSNWVAETVQRDLRVNPAVIPHGVDWEEWQHSYAYGNYILAYAKNRVMDVCNPAFISELARRYPDKLFVCTFAPKDAPGNVRITGLLPHEKMKEVIQRAAVVISPIKETFGILTLESMAAGTPVLGYNYGGNKDLIRHGVTGYLATPLDIDDLSRGLEYCIKHRDILSANSRSIGKSYSWQNSLKKLADLYHGIGSTYNRVSVIIPSYNYAEKLGDAIESVIDQTYMPYEIIVVDDGSTDDGATARVVHKLREKHAHPNILYHRQHNAGVAVARNAGVSLATGDYIVCLDADDRLAKEFIHACKNALDDDPTLGIAYTGLLAVTPDGKKTVSSWPPQYNFDNMVYEGGINQVPTCCMFRKTMWERLGGYRSRYCPQGAGSEDAEFWLRAGLYGFKGRKVTDAPLFIYSFKSGQVSGNKEYKEIDWHSLHPSTRDKLHPFACVAKPANSRPSHPVRQYDEPIVSVIIPIGPGHKQHVFNALDSLESQTLRKWEAILVDDAPEEKEWKFDGVLDILQAYPYVKLFQTEGHKGAGRARNIGVSHARASLITFLDADDNLLVPEALEKMVSLWNEMGQAVYTDYASKAVISKEEANKLKDNNRLLNYDPNDGLAMHLSYAAEYDCKRATLQPANPLYIWNLITTLIPKSWHAEIGGFDESMPSWEDWEYWLRMARAGKCFVRLAEPMVAYRFYTGGRRELGISMPAQLLSYITKKFEGVNTMPCKSCGGSKKANVTSVRIVAPLTNSENKLADDDLVLMSYENPNRGKHKVVGAITKTVYGYRQGGGAEKFYVHKEDAKAQPDWFKPYSPPVVVLEKAEPVETPPPQVLDIPVETQPAPVETLDFVATKAANELIPAAPMMFKPLDLQSVPGVSARMANALQDKGVKTWEDIILLGMDGLQTIEGIGEKRAEAILAAAKANVEKKGQA